MKYQVRAGIAGFAVLVLVASGLVVAGCRPASDRGGAASSAQQAKYHCPMHPTYVSDKPGDCPICGMKLVPIPASQAAPAAAARPARYHCPMHPTVVSDKPGDCPICEMTLVPIPATLTQPVAADGGRRIAFYRSPMDPAVHSDKPAKDSMGMDFVPVYQDEVGRSALSIAGRAVVSLTPERRTLLGVRSEEVREAPIDKTIRTIGRVAVDERRLAHMHTKFEGYVELLYVDFTGKYVQKGEPLLSIYSPDLVATQQEYLLALRAQKQLGTSQIPSVAQGGAGLLEAAKERLRLWDISPADIAEIERSGTVRRALDLHAEVSGFVVVKNVVQGMRVMPADTLFEIADLSRVWVMADVYESDLSSVRLGMPAEITLSYQPGKIWRGQVTNIAPTVDQSTRTIKVRIEVGNQGGALKPDMFGDVLLRVVQGTGLVVPDSAVIDTGERTLVFLDRADGTLEPREIEVGPRLADGYQVLRGLAKGDRVVTAANFLLDSESSLKAAISALTQPAPSRAPEKR
jgi:multidrug efflux pump subunit AcrA (membrane-fusion protein)